MRGRHPARGLQRQRWGSWWGHRLCFPVRSRPRPQPQTCRDRYTVCSRSLVHLYIVSIFRKDFFGKALHIAYGSSTQSSVEFADPGVFVSFVVPPFGQIRIQGSVPQTRNGIYYRIFQFEKSGSRAYRGRLTPKIWKQKRTLSKFSKC